MALMARPRHPKSPSPIEKKTFFAEKGSLKECWKKASNISTIQIFRKPKRAKIGQNTSFRVF